MLFFIFATVPSRVISIKFYKYIFIYCLPGSSACERMRKRTIDVIFQIHLMLYFFFMQHYVVEHWIGKRLNAAYIIEHMFCRVSLMVPA